MGASIPTEYGGTGGVMEEVIVLEELARHSSTIALAYGLDVCFGAVTILRHGTDRQRQEFLPGIASGDCHCALSLTEPDGGTDILGAMKTVAREDGDDYVINGQQGVHHRPQHREPRVRRGTHRSGPEEALLRPDGLLHSHRHARHHVPEDLEARLALPQLLRGFVSGRARAAQLDHRYPRTGLACDP
jgi:hypothetical protein